MNEQEGLQLSYDIAVENGFEGSLEDYIESLNDSKNLEKAFNQAKEEAFPDDMEMFVNGLGLGKTKGVAAEDATVAPTPEASEITGSGLEGISSESQEEVSKEVLSEPNKKTIGVLDKEISKSIPLTITDVTTETKSLEDDFILLQNQKKKNPEFGYQEEIEIQKQEGPQRILRS